MRTSITPVCARATKEIVINAIMLLITLSAFILFFLQNYLYSLNVLSRFIPGTGVERAVYNAIFVVFMYGSLAYQVSRLSFFVNLRRRRKIADANYPLFAERHVDDLPALSIIVPSYKEETHVIWQTLMSAALAEYPHRRVILLLDNPPRPSDAADRELLASSRVQIDIIDTLLSPLAKQFHETAAAFRGGAGKLKDSRNAADEAAALYDIAADFLEKLANEVVDGVFGGSADHTRAFFVQTILRDPAALHRKTAAELRAEPQSLTQVEHHFDRLDHLFRVDLGIFERKTYENLSHAPTKAANLNSYISLMGRTLKAVSGTKGIELVDCGDTAAASGQGEIIAVPDAKYIIILDADSFLMPEYAMRMISAMESPENSRAAVMQTPYTAIPGTPFMIERTAAATTDIYYYVTVGMGFANAGFWVGASATIRKAALLDIAVVEEERGYRLPAYIQDTTVIEDTGATIDLIRRGWSVQSYPDRLSYSATPSDFGALVVQRRRWANGGLIILPNLLRHLGSIRLTLANLLEAALRIHYLIMQACISTCMLLMLVYPFDFKRVSNWIYLTLPPYLYLVCRDLAHTGYRRIDIFRAYALFLILLPVVLTGVKNSLRQAIFGVKAQFGRTPKIDYRTSIPLTCSAFVIGLLTWSLIISYADIVRGDRLHAFFALLNSVALGYGVVVMMGVRAIGEDYLNACLAAGRAAYRMVVPAHRTVDPSITPDAPPLQPATMRAGSSEPSLPQVVTQLNALSHEINQLRHEQIVSSRLPFLSRNRPILRPKREAGPTESKRDHVQQ